MRLGVALLYGAIATVMVTAAFDPAPYVAALVGMAVFGAIGTWDCYKAYRRASLRRFILEYGGESK